MVRIVSGRTYVSVGSPNGVKEPLRDQEVLVESTLTNNRLRILLNYLWLWCLSSSGVL